MKLLKLIKTTETLSIDSACIEASKSRSTASPQHSEIDSKLTSSDFFLFELASRRAEDATF